MKAKPPASRDAKAPDDEGEGVLRVGVGTRSTRQLAAQVQARFRVPAGGGRRTDPAWTEKRLISLTPQTLRRLSQVARSMSADGVTVGPLQVAALLLEQAVAEATTTGLPSRHSDGRGGPVPEHAGVAAQANQRQRTPRS